MPYSSTLSTALDAHLSSSARWETATRWYETHITRDLFGDWTVIRCWGGKGSNRQGCRTDLAAGEPEAFAMVERIHRRRLHRKPPYLRLH